MKYLMIVVLVFVAVACTASPDGNVVADGGDDVQVVNVGFAGGTYSFSPSFVESGKPVKLVFDAGTLPGCARAVTLPAYGLTKLITPEDNVLAFTPESAGEVTVSCSMGMYVNKLEVR